MNSVLNEMIKVSNKHKMNSVLNEMIKVSNKHKMNFVIQEIKDKRLIIENKSLFNSKIEKPSFISILDELHKIYNNKKYEKNNNNYFCIGIIYILAFLIYYYILFFNWNIIFL
jgi:predicted double-glycine peptidase